MQNLISILEGLLQWNEDVLQANASKLEMNVTVSHQPSSLQIILLKQQFCFCSELVDHNYSILLYWLRFCILQVINNWSQPGNVATIACFLSSLLTPCSIVRSFDVIVGVFAQQLVEGDSYFFMTENILFVAELVS